MNVFNIERAFKMKKERGWDTLYIAVDFHDTLFKGHYNINQEVKLYPFADLVLRKLSERNDIVLIAYTSSYFNDFMKVQKLLKERYKIDFKYLNENPECGPTKLADFSHKFYFNILLDDKAGFEGQSDWLAVRDELIKIGEWNN